ncbi:MAG: MoaD/ThiS family protein [Thermocrispum sp.]
MLKVQVNFYASARAAAGVETEAVALPDGATLADLITHLDDQHPGPLGRVLRAVSFLVDGVATTRRTSVLPDGAQVDVLPPFAGG